MSKRIFIPILILSIIVIIVISFLLVTSRRKVNMSDITEEMSDDQKYHDMDLEVNQKFNIMESTDEIPDGYIYGNGNQVIRDTSIISYEDNVRKSVEDYIQNDIHTSVSNLKVDESKVMGNTTIYNYVADNLIGRITAVDYGTTVSVYCERVNDVQLFLENCKVDGDHLKECIKAQLPEDVTSYSAFIVQNASDSVAIVKPIWSDTVYQIQL